jgi:hypothetical protein
MAISQALDFLATADGAMNPNQSVPPQFFYAPWMQPGSTADLLCGATFSSFSSRPFATCGDT